MVPTAVLAFIIWTRLQAARIPPAVLVEEAEYDPMQVAEVDPVQVAEDDPMHEVNDELANLDILLLALYALAAVLTADLPSGQHTADRHRGVYYVKPRDHT